ncbi:addiction module antidote protein [Endozoicomonas sp. SESOKO1]|uniref:addiction module antidote protein n=1 Tax=Endozoicomonas sp. SESOKO1 TaxID=2828742 RepID=UPI0021487717|nr:addiction module antidote protein [Endozoicomonas sp. SESOKO1]
MSRKLKTFDASEYLEDSETIAEYLNAVIETGDQALLLSAIGDIAKATGMQKIANGSGLGRESLYKALTPGAKPRFDTVFKILQALGVSLKISPQH